MPEKRDTQGRRAFSEEAAAEEYAAEVKRKNADMFSELLKQQVYEDLSC